MPGRFRLAATLLALVVGVGSSALSAAAPAIRRVPRVAQLGAGAPPPDSVAVQAREAFEQGLREHGWIPGSTISVEYRYAGSSIERLHELAAELVRLGVDVVVARGTQATRAMRQSSSTIPVVMSLVADPVGSGFAASLARPGGMITGLSFQVHDLDGKQLELLKLAIPSLSRVGVLANWTAIPDLDGSARRGIEAASRRLRLEIRTFEVSTPADIAEAITAAERWGAGALLVRADPVVLEANRAEVIRLAMKHRLPAVYHWSQYPEHGGLMSYGASQPDLHRRTAAYVDRILRGARPGDLPIEQPVKFEFVVNRKTADALGLVVPPAVLVRADRVLE
jgi:putative ABC transport system substrate-binding protein